MDDDWKGEHLIRGIRRQVNQHAGKNFNTSLIVKKANGIAQCRVPGCTVTLAYKAVSGVCKVHMHNYTYCLCNKCSMRRLKMERAAKERDDG